MPDSTDDTPLRLACALVHGVAGAALSIEDGCGETWLVAHDPRAAVNPCSLRAALLGRIPHGVPPCHVHPDPALGVTVVRLSASHPSAEALLDQVGIRVLGSCLVG